MACRTPKQRKKEKSEKLRGERDQIKFIDLRFERWQVVRFKRARRRQKVPQNCMFMGQMICEIEFVK